MSSGAEVTRVSILGCGNPLRRDDGVAIAAVRLLREEVSRGGRGARWPNLQLDIIETDWPGLALLELLKGARAAFFVDAIVTGARPGTIHRFEGREFARVISSTRNSFSSRATFLTSHDLGLASVLSLGYAVHPERLPGAVTIWGVEPKTVQFGEGLSREVAGAIPILVASLCDELTRWQTSDQEETNCAFG